MTTKMKKLFKINRDGTVLFQSKLALNAFIRNKIEDYKKDLEKDISDQLYKSAFEMSALLSLEVLHMEFGFGDKRLLRFLDKYNFNMESLSEGYYEYDELKEEYSHLFRMLEDSEEVKES